ncbi:nucleotide exchange factor GrpE [Chlorobium phaeobacteroides]|jgi:molecular chaperone GrpE|uniref:Protein GrpE n=1 Tax=Chlorobium phaeobacteroides (strain DSM 266 / SMG 266 / 2430) TaxID=290317 RepID=A1BHL2_CHLPD|nr:GrpE protein [Chlorobium phaeobacteroides DSM 266]
MIMKKGSADKETPFNPVPPFSGAGESEPERSAPFEEELESSQEMDRYKAEIAELEAEVSSQKLQLDKYRDELLRRAAEFENFRKQKERETVMAGSRVLENLIREFLPMLDDVKRVLQNLPAGDEQSAEAKPYIEGVELLKRNLDLWLAEKGVKEIESMGKKLDVMFHEAISLIEHPEAEPDTIVDEYQTGYLLGDKVIRHAKVIVAK